MTRTEVRITDVKAFADDVARQVIQLAGAVQRLPIATDDREPLPRQPRVEQACTQALELLRATPLSDWQRFLVTHATIGYISPEIELEELRRALTGRRLELGQLRYHARRARETADAFDALVDDIEANSPLAQRRRRRARPVSN